MKTPISIGGGAAVRRHVNSGNIRAGVSENVIDMTQSIGIKKKRVEMKVVSEEIDVESKESDEDDAEDEKDERLKKNARGRPYGMKNKKGIMERNNEPRRYSEIERLRKLKGCANCRNAG